LRGARPRPEAPPRPCGAGDLGPAKAESPALSRVADARPYSSRFGVPRNAFLAERCLEHAQVTLELGGDHVGALVEKPRRRKAHPAEKRHTLMPRVLVKAVRV
jgi:hypothetical protein